MTYLRHRPNPLKINTHNTHKQYKQARRWTDRQVAGAETGASTEGALAWPHSPDLTDILLGHLHMDDNGVDLTVHQLPHSPCAQLQQTVLLFRQRDRQTVYSWAHPSPLHLPGESPASSAKKQRKLETQTHECTGTGGRSGPSGPPSLLSSPSATPCSPSQQAGRWKFRNKDIQIRDGSPLLK